MTNDDFRAIRKTLRLTQAELARELGYGKRQIWSYESGDVTVPAVVNLALHALCSGYRVSEKISQ